MLFSAYLTERPGSCPAVPSGVAGICVEECSDDSSCTDPKKCCSNGCGHVCTDPELGKKIKGKHTTKGPFKPIQR